MKIPEHDPAVLRKRQLRRIVKEMGGCHYCACKGRDIYAGENEGLRGRQDKRNWKRQRLTKYKGIDK